MTVMTNIAPGKLNPTHAAELAVLVELEARWENLRHAPSRTAPVRFSTLELHGVQKAYEAFRSRLTEYNKRYSPKYVPEVLLNTPVRLGIWCRKIRDLFVRIDNDASVRCPVQLVEKAYRWADLVAARMGKDVLPRPTPPGDIAAAIRELESISQRCDAMVIVEAAA